MRFRETGLGFNLVAHIDKRACWDQHKQECIGRLHSIAERCLEARRKKRPELVELIPELEEMRRGTEALPADVHARHQIIWIPSAAR